MLAAAATQAADHRYLVFVGTYTDKDSKGIYAYRFDPVTGASDSLGLVAETTNPSFLAVDPNRRYLYAVNEIDNYQGGHTGAVSAFAVDRNSGKLTLLQQVSSLGADPAHLALDKSGRFLLVANYDSGNIAAFPIEQDGRLGPRTALIQHAGYSVNKDRQAGPHAHEILASNDNQFVLTADLGLDELLVYRFNPENGSLDAERSSVCESNSWLRTATFHHRSIGKIRLSGERVVVDHYGLLLHASLRETPGTYRPFRRFPQASRAKTPPRRSRWMLLASFCTRQIEGTIALSCLRWIHRAGN